MARSKIDPAVAGRVAFPRGGWIYYAPVARDGRLLHAPVRLVEVGDAEARPDMSWSADGRLLAYSEDRGGDFHVIEARPGAEPVRIEEGYEPAFSPDGSRLAYVSEARDEHRVYVADLSTGANKLVRANALDPSWSADGRGLVVRDDNERQLNGSPLILDSSTGRLSARLGMTEGLRPLVSPDNRYLASCVSLSRPKIAPTILDITTGKLLFVPHEGEADLCWSPDSRWLGWGRWVVDPENDGSYKSLEVWITSPTDGTSRKIGDGYSPRFAPDGRHLLFVQSQGYFRSGVLAIADLHGRHRSILARGVDSDLAVWTRHHE